MEALSHEERGARPPAGRARAIGVGVVVLLLTLLAATQHPGFLGVPFVGDDYFFLDKTRDAGFATLWEPRALVSHYYRPLSRELHYWTLQRLFGDDVRPYHAASAALWLAVMALYFALARRLAGTGAAAVATAGLAALAGWGVLLVWVAGAQDLWMLLFALLFLHALAAGSAAAAAAALVAALLSKETAALLPALAVAWWIVLERRGAAAALRRALPLFGIVVLWALLHPLLGGRIWWPRAEPVLPGLHPPPGHLARVTLLSVLNLDAWPRPAAGWPAVLRLAWPGAVALAALAAWGAHAGGREQARAASPAGGRFPERGAGAAAAAARPGRAGAAPQPAGTPRRGLRHAPGSARVALFGALWAVLAWLPLLMPTLGWHGYYTVLGSAGAWLALGPALARRPAAGAALVALLACWQAARATTPSEDWGTEWLQRRVAAFTAETRVAMRRLRPSLAPHSRVFFTGLPSGGGLVAGGEESPALRWWYRDRTIRAAYLSRYAVRAPGDSLGEDVFLRFDPATGWREIVRGGEDVAAARSANPLWREDHERLAVALSRGADWSGAAREYAKLSAAFPVDPTYPYYAGLAFTVAGDSLEGARWVRRAAALPAADEEIRRAAGGLRPEAR